MDLPAPFFPLDEHVAIDLPGARAVFTTRRGGVSGGPYASLNVGLRTDDAPENVHANRERVTALVGVVPSFIRQVHGTAIHRAGSR